MNAADWTTCMGQVTAHYIEWNAKLKTGWEDDRPNRDRLCPVDRRLRVDDQLASPDGKG